MKPMLFESKTMEQITELVLDDNIVLEQKLDGVRLMVTVRPGRVFFTGAHGDVIRFPAATQHFHKLTEQLGGQLYEQDVFDAEVIFDGELMIDTGQYVIFDMPMLRVQGENVVTPSTPFNERCHVFNGPIGLWLQGLPDVSVITQAVGAEEKLNLVERVTESGGEGFMAKRLDAKYEPGRRVSHSVKVKFLHTADVIVTAWERGPGTGSARLAAYDENGELVPVGGCSLIGKPAVENGDVIEVAFAHFRGAMIQPRMLRVRYDKEPEHCTLTQFKPYSKAVV